MKKSVIIGLILFGLVMFSAAGCSSSNGNNNQNDGDTIDSSETIENQQSEEEELATETEEFESDADIEIDENDIIDEIDGDVSEPDTEPEIVDETTGDREFDEEEMDVPEEDGDVEETIPDGDEEDVEDVTDVIEEIDNELEDEDIEEIDGDNVEPEEDVIDGDVEDLPELDTDTEETEETIDGDSSDTTDTMDEEPIPEEEEEIEPEPEVEPEPEDLIAPFVVSTIPDDGDTDVAIDIYNINITFSEYLAFTPFSWDWIRIYPSDCTDGSCDLWFHGVRHELDGYTTFDLTINRLQYDTTYVVDIGPEFTDRAGNHLTPTSISFTTESAPIDGDIEEEIEPEPEPEPEPEEEAITSGIIMGTIYTSQTYIYDPITVQLFDTPPINANVAPMRTVSNLSVNYGGSTATYIFRDVPEGTYWVRAWFDSDGNGQINEWFEWAFSTYDPFQFIPAELPNATKIINIYFDDTDTSLGEISGRVYLPSSVFDTSMRVYVELYREDPDTTTTAPVARVIGNDASTSTSSFAWKANNLQPGDYYAKAFVDVCNDYDFSNDTSISTTHLLPMHIDPAEGAGFITDCDFTFDNPDDIVCASEDGDEIETDTTVEEEVIGGCVRDSDCTQADEICHYDANDGIGACELPCTSTLACQTWFGDNFFCGPDSRCYKEQTLPASIPDGTGAPLTIFINIEDTSTIDTRTCLTVSIQHPDVGELRISLEHPDGSISDLYYHRDAGVSNLNETFSVVDFNTLPRNGYWKLYIWDDYASNEGELVSYNLAFDSDCPTTDGDEDTDTDTPARLGSCVNPDTLAITDGAGFAAGNLTGLDSLMNGATCDTLGDTTGPDYIYQLDLIAGRTITVKLSYSSFDGKLYIIQPCSETATTCSGADASSNSGYSEELTFTPTINGAYYLVIDSAAGSTGDYYIDVTEN